MSVRLAIIGASGFVGSTLVESLGNQSEFEVLPYIHGAGRAARLARLGAPLHSVNLLDRSSLSQAIKSVDYVVNCSRGNNQVMLEGLENLLDTCRREGVQRFVHLSSVAVYGDPPHPQSADEVAPTQPVPASYGALKLAQDQKVQKAAKAGLPSVILCPPNITGPYSDYLCDIMSSIESGRFRLLDDGRSAVNIVDVRDLVTAIVLALRSQVTNGQRLFICDAEPVTWLDLCKELAPLIRQGDAIASIPAEEFVDRYGGSGQQFQNKQSNALKHLVSDGVRAALQVHPTWAQIEKRLRRLVGMLGNRIEERLQLTIAGPIKVPRITVQESLEVNLIRQQLRGIRHSINRAREQLSYEPNYTFRQSMADFRHWHNGFCDGRSVLWQLLVNR